MIFVEENIVVEYESKEEREDHIHFMFREGYELNDQYEVIDFYGKEHILAKFKIKRNGLKGKSIFK